MAKVKLINNTKQIGPYPGKTWVETANEECKGYKCLFPFMVAAKIEEDECDWCKKKIGPEYQCCSKKCYKALIQEAEDERRAEAMSS